MDDVEINRMIVATMLEETGIDIIEVSHGKEAVETFERSEPDSIDLILMDVMMPIMDGLEATSKIRALDRKDAKTVPIIAITANAFKEDIDKTIAAGMNAHLAKPIENENLNAMLYEHLLRRQE